jgi:hypothetical protein
LQQKLPFPSGNLYFRVRPRAVVRHDVTQSPLADR